MSPTTWTVKDRPFRTNRYGERHVEQFIDLLWNGIRGRKPWAVGFGYRVL